MAKATYKDSGVDLETYRKSMARLPNLLRRTHSPRVLSAEGGFAGLFSLDFSGKLFARNYQNPILVSGSDGVGTKLKVAQRANRHGSVGVDLVAMCVNDTICVGAEPLFFLDYVAMSHDDPALLEAIVQGISNGCIEGDMALVGGETAIMPDLYQHGDYDLAGFCVGVVEKKRLIDGKAITPDDVVIGIASNGLHSNGYSLARRIVFDIAKLELNDPAEGCNATVEEVLLKPTQIYVKAVRGILSHYRVKHVLHGIAHITGGGLHENIERILPDGVHVQINQGSWDIPPVFGWLQQLGEVDPDEMAQVFNMGIGLALIVSPFYAESILQQLEETGFKATKIGQVLEGPCGVSWS